MRGRGHPHFIEERGEIWFTDQNKGLFIARFTNGVWPFRAAAAAPAPIGLPRRATCRRGVTVRIRLRRNARSATVSVNGRRVRRVRGRAVRRPLTVRLPRGHSVVRLVVTTRDGRRLVQTRDYTRC